jgi:hypothetical protein
MNKNKPELKIYCLNQPVVATEWKSILGDKYCHALPFTPVLTTDIEEAAVIAWDGVISLKMRRILPDIASQLQRGKMLLLVGESESLLKNQDQIKIFDPQGIISVSLNGWTLLPEEILGALEACYQKKNHV